MHKNDEFGSNLSASKSYKNIYKLFIAASIVLKFIASLGKNPKDINMMIPRENVWQLLDILCLYAAVGFGKSAFTHTYM